MPEKKKSVWVFDVDDTLGMNEWQYSAAFAEFYHYLYSNFRWMMPNFNAVYSMLKKIDSELFYSYGVNRGRIAESMAQTYEEVCKWIEYRWGKNIRHRDHERQIRAIGDLPFAFTEMELLNNAKFVLHELKSRDDKLCCLSSYDKKIFPLKAKFLGLDSFFNVSDVRLTQGKKTTADFIEVSGWTQELDRYYEWYVVGNGPGDILPAMEISENWRGFYVPHGSTSAFFKDDSELNFFIPPPIDNFKVKSLRDIEEILNYI